MQDAYHRTCSHFSTRSTLGIPEGTVLRTVLTGEFGRVGSKFEYTESTLFHERCLFYYLRPFLLLTEGATSSSFCERRRCGVLTVS